MELKQNNNDVLNEQGDYKFELKFLISEQSISSHQIFLVSETVHPKVPSYGCFIKFFNSIKFGIPRSNWYSCYDFNARCTSLALNRRKESARYLWTKDRLFWTSWLDIYELVKGVHVYRKGSNCSENLWRLFIK